MSDPLQSYTKTSYYFMHRIRQSLNENHRFKSFIMRYCKILSCICGKGKNNNLSKDTIKGIKIALVSSLKI